MLVPGNQNNSLQNLKSAQANPEAAAKKLRINYLEVQGSADQLIKSIKAEDSWSWARPTPQFQNLVDAVGLLAETGCELLCWSGSSCIFRCGRLDRPRKCREEPGWHKRSHLLCWSSQVQDLKKQVDSDSFRAEYISAGDSQKKAYVDRADGSWDQGIHSFLALNTAIDLVQECSSRLWRMHKAQ